jgi:hypothetical protein
VAEPVPAEIIDVIEEDYLSGMKTCDITKHLIELGLPTMSGKPWNQATVGRICKRLNDYRETTYEDPANIRHEDLVVLRCSCGPTIFNRVTDLAHHTWGKHHRLPTREERTPTGENPHGKRLGAKLTPDKVREIRVLKAEGKMLQKDIAARFGVSDSVVHDIMTGSTWSHVV